MGIRNIEDIECCCEICGDIFKLSSLYDKNDGGIQYNKDIYVVELKEVGIIKKDPKVISYTNGIRSKKVSYIPSERKYKKCVICKNCLKEIKMLKDNINNSGRKHYEHKKSEPIKVREYVYEICNVIESLLEDKDITIPNDDREGDESEARLYGSDYYRVEDETLSILQKLVKEIKENPNREINMD